MLVQNNPDHIELLPALPQDWSKEGEIKGLRAKGDITIDMQWKDGIITNLKLYNKDKKSVKVLYNGKMQTVKSEI